MNVNNVNNESAAAASASIPSQYYLPEEAGPAGIPVFNSYMGEDGGYVAMYSHHPSDFGGSYQVGPRMWVIGIVRVAGEYVNRTFRPYNMPANLNDGSAQTTNYRDQVFSPHVPPHSQNRDFWLGGDTGGWFGLQKVDHSDWYN